MFCTDCPIFNEPYDLVGQVVAQHTCVKTELLQFSTGQQLFFEGQRENSGVFCIREGVVMIGRTQTDRLVPVYFAHPGELVGASSLTTGEFRNTAEAVTLVKACFVTREVMVTNEGLIKPEFRKKVMQQTMAEMRHIEDKLGLLHYQNLSQRLYILLLNLAEGQDTINFSVNKPDLARWLGCSERSLARSMDQLVSRQYMAEPSNRSPLVINRKMKDRLDLLTH